MNTSIVKKILSITKIQNKVPTKNSKKNEMTLILVKHLNGHYIKNRRMCANVFRRQIWQSLMCLFTFTIAFVVPPLFACITAALLPSTPQNARCTTNVSTLAYCEFPYAASVNISVLCIQRTPSLMFLTTASRHIN